MLDQINWLIDYYDNNPNVDPNVAEFMDRLIGCVEELKNTKSEQAKLELKRAISILGNRVVVRCSKKNIITDNAVLLGDVSNYSLTYRTDFEYDHACRDAFRDFQLGKKQDPMFGAISSLIGKIKDDENISDIELAYAKKLMGIYFWAKQEKRDKGKVLYSNVVEYFDLAHLSHLFYKEAFLNSAEQNYNSMFSEVENLIDPIAKAEEIKGIYEKDPQTDPNFFELLAVFFTIPKDKFLEHFDLLHNIRNVEIIRAVQNDLVSSESPLVELIRSAFEVIEYFPELVANSEKYAIATAAGVELYLCQERKQKEEKDLRFDNEAEYKTLCGCNESILRSVAIDNHTIANLINNLDIIIADVKSVYDRTKNRSLIPGEEPQQK